jgi:hypothetical protein
VKLISLRTTEQSLKTMSLAGGGLVTMRDALAKLVDQCDRKLKRGACPIIESLGAASI